MPIMLGGGEFIINGAERVVGQPVAPSAPASTSSGEIEAADTQGCTAAASFPSRGSWIELNTSEEGHARASASTRAASSRR